MTDQYIIPTTDGWGIRSALSHTVSETFASQEEALDHARTLAEKQHGALFIQETLGKATKVADFHRQSYPVEIKSIVIGNKYQPRLDEI